MIQDFILVIFSDTKCTINSQCLAFSGAFGYALKQAVTGFKIRFLSIYQLIPTVSNNPTVNCIYYQQLRHSLPLGKLCLHFVFEIKRIYPPIYNIIINMNIVHHT